MSITRSAPVEARAAVQSAYRTRLAVVATLIAATAVFQVIGCLLWTAPAGDWYGYTDIAPVRDSFFLDVTLLAATAALGVSLQAVAVMSLVRHRGALWVTVGAFLAWTGSSFLAATLGGWAMTYYVATDPGLDRGAATALLDRLASDGHLFAFGQPGSLMVTIGGILAAVGLIRSRAVPLWLPIVWLLTAPGTFLPSWGPLSLIAGVPSAIVGIAIGWYAYRRAASPTVTGAQPDAVGQPTPA
jgi:hypothetical protein